MNGNKGVSKLLQHGAASKEPAIRSTWRWWAAVGVGIVISLPVGWVLSFAGPFPFMLGVFFFALLGLIIGAIVHRVAASGRPYGAGRLWLGTSGVVLACWGTSLVVESRHFPDGAARKAASTTRYLGGQTGEEFRAAVADDIRRHLNEHYPPGGAIGYVRWISTSGELKKGDIKDVHRTLRARQQRAVWVLRVALSVGLLVFGIASQTLSLRKSRDPVVRAVDLSNAHDSD